MNKSIQVVAIMLCFALFIGACQPVPASAQESQQAQATPSLDTQSQINTAVAQTIEAQNQIGTSVALTTEAQFTATPTATLFSIPTFNSVRCFDPHVCTKQWRWRNCYRQAEVFLRYHSPAPNSLR